MGRTLHDGVKEAERAVSIQTNAGNNYRMLLLLRMLLLRLLQKMLNMMLLLQRMLVLQRMLSRTMEVLDTIGRVRNPGFCTSSSRKV